MAYSAPSGVALPPPVLPGRSPSGYGLQVTIRNIVHKGVRRLFLRDDPTAVPAATVDRLRKMLGFLQDMGIEDELHAIPVWSAHRLTGNRRGTWSLHVTRNWRLTFRIDGDEIVDVDFEDYH